MNKQKHPTIFSFNGSINVYEDGTMLELHTAITDEEWDMIVEETVKYKIFLECLKETGAPKLNEPWDEEDDWFRIQLGVAVSRMKNIDPLLVAKFDQEEIKKAFTAKMEKGAESMLKLIEQVKEEKRKAILNKLDGDKTIKVSGL